MKTTFSDGTLTIGAGKQSGWQFQLYVPKLRVERTYIDKTYTATRIVGFNLQAPTAIRLIYGGRFGEVAIGAELLGFGFAAQYVEAEPASTGATEGTK